MATRVVAEGICARCLPNVVEQYRFGGLIDFMLAIADAAQVFAYLTPYATANAR
jgi:hypothetical protein